MRSRFLAAALSALGLAIVAGCGGAADVSQPTNEAHQSNAGLDWRDQMIYQIMVDRWSDGDTNNDINIAPSVPGRFHGGDWQGVIDHLDYLQALGVTTLWISPVVKNVEDDAGFDGYHGYWTADFLYPNAHFGDLGKLRELVDTAHKRGMLVVLDIVANHVGQLFYYDINGNGQPDDTISGDGTSHSCLQICDQASTASQCSADEMTYCQQGASYLERIIEADPDYDDRGVQGWTSLGFRGPATILWPDWPDQNRNKMSRPPDWFGWPASKPWFDDPTWYHRKGRVYVWWHQQDYSNDFVREQETTGDFPGGLKDLNTENPDVAEALTEVFEYWIAAADFDGYRIDTVKHIDRPEIARDTRGFWGNFVDRLRAKAKSLGKQNFFVFGEGFDGNDQLIGSYTWGGDDAAGHFNRLDAMAYFSEYYEGIVNVFQTALPTKHLECLYNERMGRNTTDPWCQQNGYNAGPDWGDQPAAASEDGGVGLPPNQLLVNFLDNHDVARFMFQRTNYDDLRSALMYLYTWDGIPCLYYGTEQGFSGGVDPGNREDMFAGNPTLGYPAFDQTNTQFKLVQGLIAMRKSREALRRGTVSPMWSTTEGATRDNGIFGFERVSDNDKVLVVLNTGDQASSESCTTAANGGGCMHTTFAPGSVLKDIMPGSDGRTFTVGADGSIDVTVAARSGRVLTP